MSVRMKNENPVKEQIKVIDNLQETIKMQKFDISKNTDIICGLKKKLERKDRKTAKIKEELEEMRRTNNYSGINSLIKYIRVEDDEE